MEPKDEKVNNEAKEAAQKTIRLLVEQAYGLIGEAESLAKEHKLLFSFSLARGMGGTYYGYEENLNDYDDMGPGWSPSSENC